MSLFKNFLGKLTMIKAVVIQIWNAVTYKSLENTELTLFFNSQYILKALKRLQQDSRKFLVGSIARLSHDKNLSTKNVRVSFQWCPTHSRILENKKPINCHKKQPKKKKMYISVLGYFL